MVVGGLVCGGVVVGLAWDWWRHPGCVNPKWPQGDVADSKSGCQGQRHPKAVEEWPTHAQTHK